MDGVVHGWPGWSPESFYSVVRDVLGLILAGLGTLLAWLAIQMGKKNDREFRTHLEILQEMKEISSRWNRVLEHDVEFRSELSVNVLPTRNTDILVFIRYSIPLETVVWMWCLRFPTSAVADVRSSGDPQSFKVSRYADGAIGGDALNVWSDAGLKVGGAASQRMLGEFTLLLAEPRVHQFELRWEARTKSRVFEGAQTVTLLPAVDNS